MGYGLGPSGQGPNFLSHSLPLSGDGSPLLVTVQHKHWSRLALSPSPKEHIEPTGQGCCLHHAHVCLCVCVPVCVPVCVCQCVSMCLSGSMCMCLDLWECVCVRARLCVLHPMHPMSHCLHCHRPDSGHHQLSSRTAVTNLFDTRDCFCGRQCFHGPGCAGVGCGGRQGVVS